ncbi:MAG TPA: TorF family putative porin [Methylophilaceae bacterium]|nr:TorF family putative porin [Methylophilaceae bacterium]
MRKSLMLAAVLGTFALPTAVMAEEPASPHTISYNVGLYSQYIFRGLTQTAEKPALQGGVDYTHSSGFYLGTWGSNISWLQDFNFYKESSLEIDVYGGYKNTIGETGITYDVGLLQYIYPGNKLTGVPNANTTEVYGALGWKWITGKYSHALTNAFGNIDSKDSFYAELNAAVPLWESGFTVIAHVGKQKIEGQADIATYSDWKLGLTKSWTNGINVGGYYTDTDADKSYYTPAGGEYIGKEQFTAFVQKTF